MVWLVIKYIVAYNRTTEDSLYLIHILNTNGDCSVEWSPLLYLVLKWNINKMHMTLSYLSICSFTCSASNPTVLSTTVPLLSITKQVGVD